MKNTNYNKIAKKRATFKVINFKTTTTKNMSVWCVRCVRATCWKAG